MEFSPGGTAADPRTNQRGTTGAKANGVQFGRKRSIDRNKVFALREKGLGATDIARQMKIGRSTVYVILQKGKHDRAGKEESDG